jgi:hypothetical protein
MLRRVSLRFSVVVLLALALRAEADPYDFQISKFGSPQQGSAFYKPNADSNFRSFARQMGAAITSVNLAPPETLGHSGFAVNAEVSFVNFNGSLPTTTDTFAGPMVIPSIHFRKGLPGSVEIGGRAGWIGQSRMGVGTLEVKWALNEGFKYLPDIGVRGSVTKLINSNNFDLTAGGLDLGIGKQFAIGGMITLTPYVGWNLLFVGASTGNIDFNPQRTLAQADADQFKDIYVFTSLQAAANTHNRFYGGLRFIGGVASLGAEVSYSILGKNADGATIDVLAWNLMLGLDF